jgi:hypothetical protein
MSKYQTVFNDEMPPDMYDLGIETGEKYEQERIIKLLEKMPMMVYYAVANNGRILDKPCSPVVIELEAAIALIKEENKATSWTSRPLTEEDIESYGLEGEK